MSSLFDGDQIEVEGSMAMERPNGFQVPFACRARALSAGGRTNAVVAVASEPAARDGDAPAREGSYAWGDTSAEHATVTRREAEVIELISAGLSIGQAAETLERSVETIRMHVRHAREKTRTKSLAALLAWWFRHARCCPSGRAGPGTAADCEPATLIHDFALALDRPGAPAALFDLDGRPLIWSARFGAVLRVTESEIASSELGSFVAFDDRTYVQAAMQNMRSLLLRDSRIRVGLNHGNRGHKTPIEVQMGIVAKGGKPRAYLIAVRVPEPVPA
jgi:DNA-binding CsgD family transcriptional regulator